MSDTATKTMLAVIEDCSDPAKLQRICKNAKAQGNLAVETAASLKLYEVLPSAAPGTFEHDVWKSIYALEHSLSTERGRTTRLQRTRNSITDHGEFHTVANLLLKKKPSDGFEMLMSRGMRELTFEALALRHSSMFADEHLNAARARLAGT